jgi:hypothetical protein
VSWFICCGGFVVGVVVDVDVVVVDRFAGHCHIFS